ncbi:hypothetical protein PLESTF_001457300 [Pleodorina starrii]|nr:hypothetical protein PLESTF_001457300 [Pleodorina starrii]
MGYASTAATPANTLHGRSLHLASNLKATSILTNRTVAVRDAHHHFNISPGAGTSSLTAASMAAPTPFPMAQMDAAAQEKRRQQLAQYKQEKAARAGLGAAAFAPTTQAAYAGPPRVPALPLGLLRDGGQAAGEGNRSARGTGGVYNSNAGGGGVQMLARSGQLYSARHQAQTARPGAATGASGRGGGAAVNTAKAPPVPRTTMPPPGVVEQQLRTAVNAPLPKDEVWEAAQVALPADGFEEGASGPVAAKTPSSRITKSPRVVAAGGAGGTWAAPGQGPPVQQQPSAPAPAPSQQPYAPVPPRSPPPASHRAMHAGSQAAAGCAAADAYGGRMASHAEATTSDTSGRSIRDQIKMARLQGLRQHCAMALLLTDMMDQEAANNAKLAAAQAMKRTQHVLESQLPLLEQWSEYQDTHGPATREVLTALQNAMTSLPLVNGAALGMGGGMQALAQLRRTIVQVQGTLTAAEAALGMLLNGFNPRTSSGGGAEEARGVQVQAQTQAGQGQGGVPVMATLLPQLHAELVGEVANMRSLLINLNAMASRFDEVACLRARAAAAAMLTASRQSQEPGLGGFWGSADMAAMSGAKAVGAALPDGDASAVDLYAALDGGLAMLGIGVRQL